MAPATFLTTSGRGADVGAMLSEWVRDDPDGSVVMDGKFVDALWDFRRTFNGDGRIAVLDDVPLSMRAVLSEWFSGVVTATEATFLPRDQLRIALDSADAHDRFIAGLLTSRDLLLYRGSLAPLFVDRAWFVPGPRAKPDFAQLRIDDFGQTVVLGDYEVGSNAILYEHDPSYRRRVRARELERDRSFGGSLRRLRIQRGLSRSDFPGVAEKTIARIERGEIDRPQARTLEIISKLLGVQAREIETY